MGLFRGSGRWTLAVGAAFCALAGAGGLAAPAATQAQATPIRHVVVIFLENQSFDSLLGYWCDGQVPLKPARLVHRPLPASAKRLRLTPALENDPT